MAAARTAAALTCGAPVADLVDQADAGRLEPTGDHQRGCRYCRDALRDAATSRRALGLLQASAGPVPAGLVDRVLKDVRHTRTWTPLIDVSPGGDAGVAGGIRVHRQVIANLARTAVGGLPGVVVARASAAGRPGGSGVIVALGLLVDGRTPLPELARSLRRMVRTAIAASIGTPDVSVELTALDLLAE